MTDKMTAEEMLTEIGLFFIKKPKGMFILVGSVAVIIGMLYFSSIKAQNSILIDSLKVLGSTAQISDTIVKKVKEIEIKADIASKDIDEKMRRLDDVEKRFQSKREEIKRMREEQDNLIKEIEEKLKYANTKLDQIEAQQNEQKKQQEVLIRDANTKLNQIEIRQNEQKKQQEVFLNVYKDKKGKNVPDNTPR